MILFLGLPPDSAVYRERPALDRSLVLPQELRSRGAIEKRRGTHRVVQHRVDVGRVLAQLPVFGQSVDPGAQDHPEGFLMGF